MNGYVTWKSFNIMCSYASSHISSVKLCLQKGVSALYVASQEGHTDIVDILINAGADIHLATTEVAIIFI